MNLFKSESDRYSQEQLSAREAQRQAEFIAWGPVIFQISRLMLKWGILEEIRNSHNGLTLEELEGKTRLSQYALKILLEASLSAGIILIDKDSDRYTISKTGWFLLTDAATRVNIDFNHDVNYQGLFYLDEALETGKPAGLKTLGNWPTIYEGLSQLSPQVLESWLNFDHFYSDHSFDKALEIVFSKDTKHLMDVGGNTGEFALRCVDDNPLVNVTIVDLPGQIGMMKRNIEGKKGADRIHGFPTDILKTENLFPTLKEMAPAETGRQLGCDLDEPVLRLLFGGRNIQHSVKSEPSDVGGYYLIHHGDFLGPAEIRDCFALPDHDKCLFHGHGEWKQ